MHEQHMYWWPEKEWSKIATVNTTAAIDSAYMLPANEKSCTIGMNEICNYIMGRKRTRKDVKLHWCKNRPLGWNTQLDQKSFSSWQGMNTYFGLKKTICWDNMLHNFGNKCCCLDVSTLLVAWTAHQNNWLGVRFHHNLCVLFAMLVQAELRGWWENLSGKGSWQHCIMLRKSHRGLCEHDIAGQLPIMWWLVVLAVVGQVVHDINSLLQRLPLECSVCMKTCCLSLQVSCSI